MPRISLLIVLMALAAVAHAASFDCGQASTDVEKRICKSARLSKLDEALDASYRGAITLFDSYSSQGTMRERFVADQRQWLKQTRNRCKDDPCLIAAYEERIRSVDPFADKEITCEEIRRVPALIFRNGSIDLGSGYGSPLGFDYECPESLGSLPFLSNLVSRAEGIRGDVYGSSCSGSIVYALHRYYSFELTWAGIDPRAYAKHASEEQGQGEDLGARPYEKTLTYFKTWSWQSPYNFRLYNEFMAELDNARIALTKHYRDKIGLSETDARVSADHALMIIVNRAAGSSPSRQYREPSRLVALSADPRSTTKELQVAMTDASKEPLFGLHAYQALSVALLYRKPKDYLLTLMNRMGAVDKAAVIPNEEGYVPPLESVLIFSLDRPDMTQALIEHGATVDRENGFGKTPLFYAIGENNLEATKLLLRNGAHVNHAYSTAEELRFSDNCTLINTERTPLMHAAQHADVVMLKLLIEKGARLVDLDGRGANALQYAEEAKKADNVAYLKSVLAKASK